MSKRIKRTCTKCGTVFSILDTNPRILCDNCKGSKRTSDFNNLKNRYIADDSYIPPNNREQNETRNIEAGKFGFKYQYGRLLTPFGVVYCSDLTDEEFKRELNSYAKRKERKS